MDFYLTYNGQRLHFPMNPDSIQVTDAAHMESYNVLLVGGVQIPRGNEVSSVAWDGLFPGPGRQGQPFVKDWQDPKALVNTLLRWKTMGAKCRLLVTETPINLDVYISQFQHTWSGGFGDCKYHIELQQARDLVVDTVGSTTASVKPMAATVSRPKPPTPKTYTVKSGDTLWGIAKKLSGSGSNYTTLYQLNKSVIGPDPNLIKPGQVLRIPSNW
ncbi:MAG: LysM peptidoglycan-binding domain-containing protein [Alicyclobacillus macrosporangiidus]|uniref:LysM peptidoglycan-binding domain-containing protein n=1 Tax=Alicyclobacillus macrosporangiidus TaxID=392015 RepID=UPI0026E999BB|nr:LysM peptidoglycan-binding domain-containing protein [Alicyclobacillus macrosporangiidus]MCL6597935.1 LysM peptidoglycan-binding domain-containing protein [Alicyclobacillus macrosporangiidus]